MKLDKKYWADRYVKGDTPWDLGKISPPLRHYFEKLSDKDIKILIPGAGRAHEALYLHQNGFLNVFVCDWAAEALDEFKVHCPDFPERNLICADFFSIDDKFDFIIEQTFFCALPPALRENYVSKVHDLLSAESYLVGLFFATEFPFQGPPFGGTEKEYRSLFEKRFEIENMSPSKDSIGPRLGNELFFKMKKRG